MRVWKDEGRGVWKEGRWEVEIRGREEEEEGKGEKDHLLQRVVVLVRARLPGCFCGRHTVPTIPVP